MAEEKKKPAPYAKLKRTLDYASRAAANNHPQEDIEAEIIKAG